MIPEFAFRIFQMPPMPDIELGIPGSVGRTAMWLIMQSYVAVFRSGVYQGFIAGSLATVIVTQGLGLRRQKEKT